MINYTFNLYKHRNKIIIDNSNSKLLCYANCISTRNHYHQLNNNGNNEIDEQLKTKINNYDNKILLNVELNLKNFVNNADNADNVDDNDNNIFINLFTLTQKKIYKFFFIYFNNNNTKLLLRKKYYQNNNNNNKFNYLLNNNIDLKNIYNDLLSLKGELNFNTILINKLQNFDLSSNVYYSNTLSRVDNGKDISNNKLSNQSLILFNFNNRYKNSNYFELSILDEYDSNYIKNIFDFVTSGDYNYKYKGTNLTNNFYNNLLITTTSTPSIAYNPLLIENEFVSSNTAYLYTRPRDNPIDNNINYLSFKYSNSDSSRNFDINFNIINTGYNKNKIYFVKTLYNNDNISKNTLFITGKLLKKNDYELMKNNKKKIFLSFGNGICGINSISLCNNLHLGKRSNQKNFIFTDIIKLFNSNFLINLDFNFQLNHNEYYVNNFLYNKINSFIKIFTEKLNHFYDISYTPFLVKDINIIENRVIDSPSITYRYDEKNLNIDSNIKYKIKIEPQPNSKYDLIYDFKFNYNKLIESSLNIPIIIENLNLYDFDLINRIFITDGSDFQNVNCIFVYNDINQGVDGEYKYPYNNIDICNNPSIDTIENAIVQLKFKGDRRLKNYSIIPNLNNNNLTKKQIYSYIATNNIPKLLSLVPKDNSIFTIGRDEGLNLGSDLPVICNNDEESQKKKFKEIFKNKYNENNKINNKILNKRNYAKLVRSSNNVRKKMLECNN